MKNLYDEVYQNIDNGDLESALKIVSEIEKLDIDIIEKEYVVSGLYIDIGTISYNEEMVQRGIELMLKYIDNIENQEKIQQGFYYNFANGYSSIFNIKKQKDFLYGYMNSKSENIKAINFYYRALKCKGIDKKLTIQIYINLANALDIMGRGLEAIKYYDKALEIDSNYGMALVNKGIAIKHYAKLTGENWGIYYKISYDLIKRGILKGVNNECKEILTKVLLDIEKSIDVKSVKCISNKSNKTFNSEFDKFLNEFCIKNKLYLNLCDECQKCNYALNDNIIIKKMTIDINVKLNEDPFLQLSSFLNEIKQNYVTARFLLAQSRYDELDLSFVDKNVVIVNTLNYIENNIYIQLLKFSFKNMFDILDKIAIFINKYLSLNKNERYVDFNNIWYKNRNQKIHNKILKENSINLNALFSLSLDLTQGELKILSDIRNALTHRFLNVYMFGDDDLQQMNEECLFKHTVNISKVVKSAIMYLMSFVDEMENKKEKNENGNEVTVPFRIKV